MPIIPDEEEFDARMPPWVPGQEELEYGLPEAMLLDDTQQTEMLDAPELASEPEPDDQQNPQGAGQAPANWPPSMRKFSASGRQIMGGQERKAARAANRPQRAAPAQPAPVPAPGSSSAASARADSSSSDGPAAASRASTASCRCSAGRAV